MKFFFKKHFITFFLLCYLYGQNTHFLDSLDNSITRIKTEDEKIKIISKLFLEITNKKYPDKVFNYYFERYYVISKKENLNKMLQSLYHQAGVHYYYLSEYDKAEAFLDSAILIGKKINHEEGLMGNYMTRGAIRFTQSDYHSSLSDYLESEKLMKKLKSNRLGGLYNNIALIYTELNELDLSEHYSNLALYYLNVNGDDEQSYLKILNNLGLIYKKKNQLNKADSIFRKGIDLAKKTNHLRDASDMLYNLANILYMKSKNSEALECYKELEKIMPMDEIDKQNWLKVIYAEMALLYIKLKNKNASFNYLTKAESISWSPQAIPEQKSDYYMAFAEACYELNLFEKSAMAYRQLIELKSSEKIENEYKNVQKIKYQYEKQKDSLEYSRLKEIETLKSKQFQTEMEYKINRQKIIIVVSVLFLILISLFSAFLVRSIKDKIKVNHELSEQKQIVQRKNEEITDSINYAKRIQQSLLPTNQQMAEILNDFFLLYLPKDIVSGDFYWIKKINENEFFLGVGDCTGHGVPGAIMSALSIQQLNELSFRSTEPNEILTQLNNSLKKILQQDEEGQSKDGLDISLCKLNINTGKLIFSGANRNLWIFKENDQMQEIKADKCGIGGHTPSNQSFQFHEIELQKNDLVVLSTDGFADQFGGDKLKKIGSRKLKELISVFKTLKTDQIHIELENFFIHWKQQSEQTDDVCVLGFKFNPYAYLS
jgi:serine phosphatase RsbU (regulator of sigma subunit)